MSKKKKPDKSKTHHWVLSVIFSLSQVKYSTPKITAFIFIIKPCGYIWDEKQNTRLSFFLKKDAPITKYKAIIVSSRPELDLFIYFC